MNNAKNQSFSYYAYCEENKRVENFNMTNQLNNTISTALLSYVNNSRFNILESLQNILKEYSFIYSYQVITERIINDVKNNQLLQYIDVDDNEPLSEQISKYVSRNISNTLNVYDISSNLGYIIDIIEFIRDKAPNQDKINKIVETLEPLSEKESDIINKFKSLASSGRIEEYAFNKKFKDREKIKKFIIEKLGNRYSDQIFVDDNYKNPVELVFPKTNHKIEDFPNLSILTYFDNQNSKIENLKSFMEDNKYKKENIQGLFDNCENVQLTQKEIIDFMEKNQYIEGILYIIDCIPDFSLSEETWNLAQKRKKSSDKNDMKFVAKFRSYINKFKDVSEEYKQVHENIEQLATKINGCKKTETEDDNTVYCYVSSEKEIYILPTLSGTNDNILNINPVTDNDNMMYITQESVGNIFKLELNNKPLKNGYHKVNVNRNLGEKKVLIKKVEQVAGKEIKKPTEKLKVGSEMNGKLLPNKKGKGYILKRKTGGKVIIVNNPNNFKIDNNNQYTVKILKDVVNDNGGYALAEVVCIANIPRNVLKRWDAEVYDKCIHNETAMNTLKQKREELKNKGFEVSEIDPHTNFDYYHNEIKYHKFSANEIFSSLENIEVYEDAHWLIEEKEGKEEVVLKDALLLIGYKKYYETICAIAEKPNPEYEKKSYIHFVKDHPDGRKRYCYGLIDQINKYSILSRIENVKKEFGIIIPDDMVAKFNEPSNREEEAKKPSVSFGSDQGDGMRMTEEYWNQLQRGQT